MRDIRPLPRDDEGKVVVSGPSAQAAAELADLVASLADTQASAGTHSLILTSHWLWIIGGLSAVRRLVRIPHDGEVWVLFCRVMNMMLVVWRSPRAPWLASAEPWIRRARWSPSWMQPPKRRCAPQWP